MLTFLSLQTQQETLDPERRMAKVHSFFTSYCWCVDVLHSSLTLNRHSVDRQAGARDLNKSIKTHIHQVGFTPSSSHFRADPSLLVKNKNPRHFLLPSEVHKMVLSPLSGCLGVTGVNLSLCLLCFLHRAEQAPHPSGGYVTARSRRLIL